MLTRQFGNLDNLFWRPWSDFFTYGSDLGAASEPSRYRTGTTLPPLNLWAHDSEALVTMEAPGIDKESLDITIQGQTLTIKGERKSTELDETATYRRRERRTGTFTRIVELPDGVDFERVKASYQKGILEISLPRLASELPKKIVVTAS